MSTELMERVIPQAIEAEQSALGAMLLDADAIDIAESIIVADDFFLDAHRNIYRGIIDLHGLRKPVDLVTLGEWLTGHNCLEQIGGTHYLTTMMSQVPTASGIAHYCRTIREKSHARQLIRLCDETMTRAYEPGAEILSLLTAADDGLLALTQPLDMAKTGKQLSEVLKECFYEYEEAATSGTTTGMATGWKALNRILEPLHPGQMMVVAARPGMGKTAFIFNLAMALGVKDITSYFFSFEMEGGELGMRAMLAQMTTARDQIDDPVYVQQHPEVLADMAHSVESLWHLPIWIDDRGGVTIAEMRRTLRRQCRICRPKFVFVDYVQLTESEGRRGRNRAEEVGTFAFELANMAKEFKVVMVVCSQLSREVEKQSPYRPRTDHLYESGKLEAAAHRIIYLYRPAYYGKHECSQASDDYIAYPQDDLMNGVTEIGVLKQRSGRPRGRIALWYEGEKYLFRDLYHDEYEKVHPNRNR